MRAAFDAQIRRNTRADERGAVVEADAGVLRSYRAGLAAARGYRYLQVDALPASRAILQRLGFKPVAATTPYVWTPQASR